VRKGGDSGGPRTTPASGARVTPLLASVGILVALVLLVYAPVRQFDFVSYDDPSYVSENVHVAAGLAWPSVTWAFSAEHGGYWIPLTWISYMTDVQVAGVGAGAHHVTNVLLHLLNTLLLYGLLRRVTGATGRSLFVAALFAVHPLHVESVAWVTERKDVLSTAFLMLALWSYVSYVRRPSARRYATVAAWFVCGLMAKPMVVTLPFLLVLLDVWPLARVTIADDPPAPAATTTWTKVLVEKLPLVAIAVAAGIATFATQHRAGAVADSEFVGPVVRLATAVTAYATYIWKTCWPSGLAAFYPYQMAVHPLAAGAALLALVGISALAIRLRRHPFVAVGWLWYLVALGPTVGLIQVGNQSMADRFTYVPLIGLFVIVSWGVPALFPRSARAVAALAAVAVLASAAVASAQVETWRNDDVLWQHALDVVPDNYFAHNSLGRRLYDRGQVGAAAPHFEEAVRLAPRFYDGRNNLGLVLLSQGRLDEAVAQFREAIRLKPTAEALSALGAALAQLGDLDGAVTSGREAVRLGPDLAEAHFNLGLTLSKRGRVDEAIGHYLEARRLEPDLVQVHQGIGEAMIQLGRLDEAASSFREALRLDSSFPDAHHGLGVTFSARGRLDEAIAEYAESVRLAPARPRYHNDLGFALAARGKVVDAIPHFSEAVRLAPDFEQARYFLGLALAGTGQYREARVQLNEAVRLDPSDEGARKALERLPRQ
jgi:protein O-mannosyl-transferase